MKEAILNLARPEILALNAYEPASYTADAIRLNANEAPWRPASDSSERSLNLYPEARPTALTALLASHYGVGADQTFVTRGTSEAIDLMIRCFCRPDRDEIVICPPTFGMYQVYAGIQGAGVRRVALLEPDFSLDVERILNEWDSRQKILFLTSPNNPTGNAMDPDAIEALCEALLGRGLVVLDAAYLEFSGVDPSAAWLSRHANLVVLRTLSKAYGLAGARCGVALCAPPVVELLGKVMPPYAIPTPTAEAAIAAVRDESFGIMPKRIEDLRRRRDRLKEQLEQLDCVERVWPSDANFLLVRFDDAPAALAKARAAGLLLRDFSRDHGLENCLRITVGEQEAMERLLDALAQETASV